jgi:hypothetical protein
MSARLRVSMLAAIAVVATAAVSPVAADAKAPPGWTSPQRIPGTAGLFNPAGYAAPDGTDLVLWGEGAGGTENQVRAKVRLSGRDGWLNVPVRLHGSFLGITDVEPTAAGDFWVVYQVNAGPYASYLAKLDSRARHWSKPVALFRDQVDHYHGSPRIESESDGTLVVTAYSPLIAGGGEARVSVGVRPTGGHWHNRFLSPPGHFAFPPDLSVNPSGDILISFIQESDLADMIVRAATKAHRRHATWKTSTLSVPGDSQRVHSAIGADGTAVAVWTATSSTFDAVRMATRDVRRPLAPWVEQDVVTSTPVSTDAYGLVDPHGNVTALWSQNSAGTITIWSRYLHGATLDPAVQLSPLGESAGQRGFAALPNGRAAVLYQRFAPGGHSLGMDYRTLKNGTPGPAVPVVGDETTDGDANSQWLSFDAASQATIIYNRGTNPDVDFAWLANAQARPAVTKSPWSSSAVRNAHVAGETRVGGVVRCESGYWVETSSLSYHWERDGQRIHGATSKRYDVARRDSGHDLACRVLASNSSPQKLLLASPERQVR